MQFTQESPNFLFHLSLGLTFVWVTLGFSSKWFPALWFIYREEIVFNKCTLRVEHQKPFSHHPVWYQLWTLILLAQFTLLPRNGNSIHGHLSFSLGRSCFLAGELQSVPALPRTMMDTFMPHYYFYQPQIHISYFILSRCSTSNILKLL